jgi:D-Tyr-tRNAtyr deacylase
VPPRQPVEETAHARYDPAMRQILIVSMFALSACSLSSGQKEETRAIAREEAKRVIDAEIAASARRAEAVERGATAAASKASTDEMEATAAEMEAAADAATRR